MRSTIPIPPSQMTDPLPPTKVLPALPTIHVCNVAAIRDALRVLQDTYFPRTPSSTQTDVVPAFPSSLSKAVSASRSKLSARLFHTIPDSGYASAEEEEDQNGQESGAEEKRDANKMDEEEMEWSEELKVLRSDQFERGYAIKWLTGLVKRSDTWVRRVDLSEEQEAREALLEGALGLLARFAGNDTPEEALTRTFVFPLRMPSCRRCSVSEPWLDLPIRVELNDAPVDGTDHTAVGLQSWGSAIVFAERMCSNPERYLGAIHACPSSPTSKTSYQCQFLELGAGTGLLSVTAAQVLSRMSIVARITATDYHPSVLDNLTRNVQHNPHPTGVTVSVGKLDWCAVARAEIGEDEVVGVYDVVLAADVVYLQEHAHWIRQCVERMMKRDGVFWLIIPVRTVGRHEGLGDTVEEAFPLVDTGKTKMIEVGERDELEGGDEKRLATVHWEEVGRIDGLGRADEGSYRLFEIRWV